MARLKYDGYRDFQAGMRFIESLATWLQQFKPAERETAYTLLSDSTLVYIGPSEMQRLVEQFYPRTVRDRLMRTVAAERAHAQLPGVSPTPMPARQRSSSAARPCSWA